MINCIFFIFDFRHYFKNFYYIEFYLVHRHHVYLISLNIGYKIKSEKYKCALIATYVYFTLVVLR